MNCWEYKNCPPEIHELCPAFPNNGHECWKIPGTKCEGGAVQFLDMRDKAEYCFECDFYDNHGQRH